MRLSKIMLFAILALIWIPAQAQNNSTRPYLGFDILDMTFEPQVGSDLGLGGFRFILGYDLSNFLALEAHVGVTDTATDALSSVTLKVDYFAGAYVRLNLPFNKVTLYALGGGAHFATKLSGVSDTDNGLSYGVGIEMYGNPRTAIHLSWMNYLDDDNFDFKTVMIGVVHHFRAPSIYHRY